MLRLRALASGVHHYAAGHGSRLAPDLSELLIAARAEKSAPGEEQFATLARTGAISPAHPELQPPEQITPAWVNQSASYAYLGSGDISLEAVGDWSGTVIAHLRLEQGHTVPVTPENPEGQVFPVAFLDGHVEMLPRSEAASRIARSQELFTYLRTGKGLSEDRLALEQLATIVRAVRAYAAAHDGKLPPDLGSTLEHVPGDSGATATPARRARIFLSPRAVTQESTFVPENPTPEWVNEKCWYVYLGDASVSIATVPAPDILALVLGPPADGLNARPDGAGAEPVRRVPVATPQGSVSLQTRLYAEWVRAESRRTFDSIRENTPLPPWLEAWSDIAAISSAITAYAEANDGRLPPDLAATVAFLPDHVTGTTGGFCQSSPYISPGAERRGDGAGPPDLHAAAKSSSYVYLAAPGPSGAAPTRDAAGQARVMMLLHSPLTEPYAVSAPKEWAVWGGRDDGRISVWAGPWGNVHATERDALEQTARESRTALAKLAADPPKEAK